MGEKIDPAVVVLAEYEAVNRTLSSFLVLQFYSDRGMKKEKSNLFGDKLVWFDSECSKTTRKH